MHDRFFVELDALCCVNIALDLASHHNAVRRDVARDFASQSDGNSHFIVFGGFNITNHFAVDAHTIEQYQASVDLCGAANDGVKTLLRWRQRLVFEFFKHLWPFIGNRGNKAYWLDTLVCGNIWVGLSTRSKRMTS